jgi:ligand-binding SRPBCC domain-containing protein
MPTIIIETPVHAAITTCFDLSRSIDLHQISTKSTHEKAIAGTTTGLIGLGEYVTWEARHLGVRQKLTTAITQYDRPSHFRDEQVAGAFAWFIHDHYFTVNGEEVVMKDIFQFESPLGWLGRWANRLFLTNYMRQLLLTRNAVIKTYAETDQWRTVLLP